MSDDKTIPTPAPGAAPANAPTDGEARTPDRVLEEITGAGEEVTGYEAQAFLARRAYLRETSDADLLAALRRAVPASKGNTRRLASLGPLLRDLEARNAEARRELDK